MSIITGCEGTLNVHFDGRVCDKTVLTRGYCKFPLHFTPPMYLDEHVPQMAFLYIQNTTGGICGGDRLNTCVTATERARLHITGTAATKVYRTDRGPAWEEIKFEIGKGAYVEYLPPPLIPYAGSNFRQNVCVDMCETSTFVATEVVAPGRECRGEIFDYSHLRLQLDVKSAGVPICSDALVLEPTARMPSSSGVFGPYTNMATVYAVAPWTDVEELYTGIRGIIVTLPECLAAGGTLPFNAGVFVKILSRSPAASRENAHILFNAIRSELLGAPLLRVRK